MRPPPRIGLAHVRGRSMWPTLQEGDRVVVAWGLRPRAGRMVLVRLPDGPDGPRPLAIKRATRVSEDAVFVEGDNLAAGGVDSWTLGELPRVAVEALVLARLPRRRPRPGTPRQPPR